MHFQLFIPGATGQDPRLLEEVGLADFVAGAEFMPSAKGPAPEGRPGVLVAWRRPGSAMIGYHPDKQTWFPAVARDGLEAGRFWVGLWNDSPVTPQDLARPYPQPGSRVQLGDGNEWLLPAAKELDATLKLADDGTWKFEVQRRFHAFYLEYLKWFHFFGTCGEGDEYAFADAADFVMAGLRINYRLVPELASQLELFSKSTVNTGLLSILGVSLQAGG
jgi:hypothetical protein